MVSALYNVGIRVYGLLITIASFFNHKARRFKKGRKELFPRLRRDFQHNHDPIAWFHCASLGEFEQGRTVIEAFKLANPHYRILLTFFSPSGYEVRKDYPQADFVHYLPLDTRRNAELFISIVQPHIAYFIKYEFWANYLQTLKRNEIPIISFSAIFRSQQIFFKPWGNFYRNVLRQINQIFVQNENSIDLLKKHNIKNASLAGDTRFDRVFEICQQVPHFSEISQFCQGKKVFIIGSSWPADQVILNKFINDHPELKFIIAPHEIKEIEITQLQEVLKHGSIRYSDLKDQIDCADQVLIIDNVGMLSSLYQYGNYAYIGGAFGKGLHNILEAVTFGLPVFFGNLNYRKFKEATDLTALKGVFPIKSMDQLTQQYDNLNNDPELYNKTSKINKQYIKDNIGGTRTILNFSNKLINGR